MGKAWCIAVQFALMDGGALMVMQELDWIFDGDDVVILFAVDGVEQYRQGGRLARSSRSGYQDDSVSQLGDFR